MTITMEERLLKGAARDAQTGCLRWRGSHNHKGYGYVLVDGKKTGAHRVAYELWIGPIPDGHEIDHVSSRGCAYRDCIESSHLEAVTHAENVRRSSRTRGEYCYRGHRLTEATTRIRKSNGCRICKVCASEPVACECGASVGRRHLSRHRASKVHADSMAIGGRG